MQLDGIPTGRLHQVQLERHSGVQRVDLAVQRLVAHAGPLLPYLAILNALMRRLDLTGDLLPIVRSYRLVEVDATRAFAFQAQAAIDHQVLGPLRADDVRRYARRVRLVLLVHVDRGRALRENFLRRARLLRRALDRHVAAMLPPAHIGVDGICGRTVRRVDGHGAQRHLVAAGVDEIGLQQHVQVEPGAGVLDQRLAVDLAPIHQPRFHTTAPGAYHDSESVVLNVDACGQHHAAPRDGFFLVVLGTLG